MKKSEARILDMCVRVRQHGLTRAAFPASSRGHELYALVDFAARNIQRCSAEQTLHTNAAKGMTVQKRLADKALSELMEIISRTARSMSLTLPGMEEKFRLPSNNDKRTLLAAARAFVMEAGAHTDEFVAREMAPDFVDELKARILAVEQAVNSRAEELSKRVAATVALAQAAAEGLAAVRELDAIIRNAFTGNHAEIAAWESASHIERAPQRAQEEEEEEQPPANPAPAQG